MEPSDHYDGPPIKRRRLSRSEHPNMAEQGVQSLKQDSGIEHYEFLGSKNSEMRDLQKETRAGIIAFVNPTLAGFSGILKQRYTDFLVNEILPDGAVLHLQDLHPAQMKDSVGTESGRQEARSPVKSHVSYQASTGIPSNENCFDHVEDETIGMDDQNILQELLGRDVALRVLPLYQEVLKQTIHRSKVSPSLKSEKIGDKGVRTQVHQEIRRIFKSKLETTTADDDTINITATVKVGKARGGSSRSIATRYTGRLGWEELGGEYVHFTLYKENKDTMEAIGFLSSQLHTKPKTFQFGGTKDRRAVTVQRCSAYRIRAEQLAALNARLTRSRVGDFSYATTGLELGDLGGNEFVITLRDCHFLGEEGLHHSARLALAEDVLGKSIESFRTSGFVNYFGLQRFGTFAVSNDVVGLKLIKGNLAGAISDILAFDSDVLAAAQDPVSTSMISQDDKARAEAINIWLTTGNAARALARLPRKFSAESNVIRHLGRRDQKNDYQGALNTIPRNLRLMYVHAYQSMVWNRIAGKRWQKHGATVIEGDLVLVNEHGKRDPAAQSVATVDDQGEPIIHPGPNDRATKAEEDFERARSLSAIEAADGRYNIFDVVLPLPGYDVEYPQNSIGEEYSSFMKSEEGGGLDPNDMRRSWRDVSLSGGYRKVLARPGDGLKCEVRSYINAEEQLVQTDLEILKGQGEEEARVATEALVPDAGNLNVGLGEDDTRKLAVILRMKLGPSQYATIALRELMQGGVKNYKSEFGGGR